MTTFTPPLLEVDTEVLLDIRYKHQSLGGGVTMEDSVVSESPVPETQECDNRSSASEQDRSSATEGPDSPDLSPSCSPGPMMLPSDTPDSDFPAPRYSVK